MQLISFGACRRALPPGSPERPVTVLLYPGLRGDQVRAAQARIAQDLRQATGLYVTLFSPVDYFESLSALGDGEADVVFLNGLSFVAAQKLYKVRAPLQVLRGQGRSAHHAQILVRPDGPNSLAGLAAARIAYVDPHSVSGYLIAAHSLKKLKVAPATVVFAGSHREALRQVLTGEADAAATYVDETQGLGVPRELRSGWSKEQQSLVNRLRGLPLPPQIPNEPVVLRADLSRDLQKKLSTALLALAKVPESAAALSALGGIEGFAPGKDADYWPLAQMLDDLGKGAEEALPGGWKLRSIHSDDWPGQK